MMIDFFATYSSMKGISGTNVAAINSFSSTDVIDVCGVAHSSRSSPRSVCCFQSMNALPGMHLSMHTEVPFVKLDVRWTICFINFNILEHFR
jgi:hypothetical protein